MLDITEVILTEGKKVTSQVELGLDVLSYKIGRFPIQEKTPVEITAENLGDRKLGLSGSVILQVLIPCARCLDPVNSRIEVRFEFETGLDETEYIDGYNLDVDQLIHDESMLVWPERVLCREDCKGLCSTCGQNLNDGPCGCEQTVADPRMAKILDIFNNFKEV